MEGFFWGLFETHFLGAEGVLEKSSWHTDACIAFFLFLFDLGVGSYREGVDFRSLKDIWIFFFLAVLHD